jgi:hypothetical protein
MPIYSNVMAKDDTLKGLSDTSIVLICTVVTSENLWKMNVLEQIWIVLQSFPSYKGLISQKGHPVISPISQKGHPVISPISQKGHPVIKPDLRCIEIVKYN